MGTQSQVREVAAVASGLKQDAPHCQGGCTEWWEVLYPWDLSTRRGRMKEDAIARSLKVPAMRTWHRTLCH